MSERISNERLREMASPTWRFVSDEYREAVNELLIWREFDADMRRCQPAMGRERIEQPLTVGPTTRYPPMPREAWDKLREERDALLGEVKRMSAERYEATMEFPDAERLRDHVSILRDALTSVVDDNDIACARRITLETWPDSELRRRARAALAATEPK